jgi:hypothetical protein
MAEFVLCSNCLSDQGLKLDSLALGVKDESTCKNCGSTDGRKLTKDLTAHLAYRFFVRGTTHRSHFGGSPVIQFNQHQRTSIIPAPWLESDVRLIERVLGVGFFYYGPRLWMVGEIEPLKALQLPAERPTIIKRIVTEYPHRTLTAKDIFYRIRRSPKDPASPAEYDSPPEGQVGNGRLDSTNFPVMYASQDLPLCIHECRATVDDLIFVATLATTKELKLLDLTHLLEEKGSEFESLDLAVHMLFLAENHSYEISRDIAVGIRSAGFDGAIYPSYFSLVRVGCQPFETAYGISIRKLPVLAESARQQILPNLAIFGRPIAQGFVAVRSINRVILNRVDYDLIFGPVGYE